MTAAHARGRDLLRLGARLLLERLRPAAERDGDAVVHRWAAS